MSRLTQDIAAEQYQLACDELMELAEDYEASEEAADLALAAAQKLTLKYIDIAVENIHALNRQYDSFIDTMEDVVYKLGKTPLERFLLDPIKQRLKIAKKKVLN